MWSGFSKGDLGIALIFGMYQFAVVFSIVNILDQFYKIWHDSAVLEDCAMLNYFVNWPIIAIVAPGLLFFGWGAMSMTPPLFKVAIACFSFAVAIFLVKFGTWIVTIPLSIWYRTFITFIVFGLVGIGLVQLLWLVESKQDSSQASIQATYHLVPSIQSRIVSRLYARENILDDPNASRTHYFLFQELFYEWELTLSADKSIERVSGQIDHLKEGDRFRVVPEDTKLSPLLPKWFSGFIEPARKKPDYFARTFEVKIAPKMAVTITIRRPLMRPLISEGEIINISDIRSLECCIELPRNIDVKAEVRRLSLQATTLAQWLYSPRQNGIGLPIHADPGDVTPDEIQITVEAWCQTDFCNDLTMSKMEVHMGRSPEEWSKFGR